MPPPQRAKQARKSARCGLRDGSPRPHPPQPQPVGSGPRSHARPHERSGVVERPTPDAARPGKRRPAPGTLMPPPQRAKPARKSARCGLRDGSPRPHPPQPQPVGSGPRSHARPHERSGVVERPTPDAARPGKRRPAPGTLMPPPQRAKPARKSARCGVGDGSPCPHPPHRQPVGSGPRTHARKNEWSGVGERPTPDAPHPGKRHPPRAPSCRIAQRSKPAHKSARCGVGYGSLRPHPPHPRPVDSGPRPHARKDDWSGVGEHPTPGPPAPRQEAPPPGALVPPLQRAKPARKASSQELARWGW